MCGVRRGFIFTIDATLAMGVSVMLMLTTLALLAEIASPALPDRRAADLLLIAEKGSMEAVEDAMVARAICGNVVVKNPDGTPVSAVSTCECDAGAAATRSIVRVNGTIEEFIAEARIC